MKDLLAIYSGVAVGFSLIVWLLAGLDKAQIEDGNSCVNSMRKIQQIKEVLK